MSAAGNITLLLQRAAQGDSQAESRLLVLINDEFRREAARVARQRGSKEQATSLVNEAWIKLFRRESGPLDIQSRAVLFDLMLRQIEWVLLDRIRRANAGKRALQKYGEQEFRSSSDLDRACDTWLDRFSQVSSHDFVSVKQKLDRLCRSRVATKQRRHKLFRYVHVGGLGLAEAAELLGISPTQAGRDLQLAKAELQLALAEGVS